MADWYYENEGQRIGPVPAAKLRELVQVGTLQPSTLVWKDGLVDWVPAGSLKGLVSGEATQDVVHQTGGAKPLDQFKKLVVTCPNCRARYKINESSAVGRRVACKACGNSFVAGAAARTTAPIQLPIPDKVITPRTLNDDELAVVRQRITSYAASMPHCEIEALGEAAHFTDSVLSPIYRVLLNTLYESRTAERRESPFVDQEIQILCTTEENVDCWSYAMSPHMAFEGFREEMTIADSREVLDCGDCESTGVVACSECKSRGRVTCPTCEGTSAMACPRCSGRGQVTQSRRLPAEKKCYRCWGTGVIGTGAYAHAARMQPSRCPSCYGRGFSMGYDTENFDVPCDSCRATGNVRCTNCGATGAVVCGVCHGDTTITCPRCEGQARVVSYLSIVREIMPVASHATKVNCDNSKGDTTLLETQLNDNDDSCVVVAAQSDLISLATDGLSQVARVPVLADMVQDLLGASHAEITQNRRIVRQAIQVRQTVATFANYVHDGQHYAICTLGGHATLLPHRNPITDKAVALFDKAIADWNAGNKSEAATCYRQFNDMAAKDSYIKTATAEKLHSVPSGLKTAVTVGAAMVSAKALALRGTTKASEAIDAVKNSKVGQWLLKRKDGTGKQE